MTAISLNCGSESDQKAIGEQLARILGSRPFARSRRMQRFLEYIVVEALAGRSDRLKAYNIALEVFDRPETFDPIVDPLVRVEAARLREMNREYYVADGQDDPIHIGLPSAPSRHAGLLFNRLLKSNADYAIDFHTSATGMDMSAFHLARMDLPEVREMAELFPIDQIFDNPGYPGLLANAFIDAGIPAFTPEIGAPRILDLGMIPLFVEGTMNVLKHHGIIDGPISESPHRHLTKLMEAARNAVRLDPNAGETPARFGTRLRQQRRHMVLAIPGRPWRRFALSFFRRD